MAVAALSVKQGATLQLLLELSNDDNSAFDLTTVSYDANVRNSYGHLVDTLDLIASGTPGVLTVQQDTALWPVGVLSCDLKFTSLSTAVVIKSDTFAITVIAAVTA